MVCHIIREIVAYKSELKSQVIFSKGALRAGDIKRFVVAKARTFRTALSPCLLLSVSGNIGVISVRVHACSSWLERSRVAAMWLRRALLEQIDSNRGHLT